MSNKKYTRRWSAHRPENRCNKRTRHRRMCPMCMLSRCRHATHMSEVGRADHQPCQNTHGDCFSSKQLPAAGAPPDPSLFQQMLSPCTSGMALGNRTHNMKSLHTVVAAQGAHNAPPPHPRSAACRAAVSSDTTTSPSSFRGSRTWGQQRRWDVVCRSRACLHVHDPSRLNLIRVQHDMKG